MYYSILYIRNILYLHRVCFTRITFFFKSGENYFYLFIFFRRGKEFSGDIDTLISHPMFTSNNQKKKSDKLQIVVDVLKKINLITETISLGETKFMVGNNTFIFFKKIKLYYIL